MKHIVPLTHPHRQYKVLLGKKDFNKDGLYVLECDDGTYGVYEGSPWNGWFGGWPTTTRREAFMQYFTLIKERGEF